MRGGLDDALDKLARRDELRRRAAGEVTGTPPAVTELVEAIAAVVGHHPELGVTVGVEGAGDPLLLHFYFGEGQVQVNAENAVGAQSADPVSPAPRHADFEVEVVEPDPPTDDQSRSSQDDQEHGGPYAQPAAEERFYDESDTAERRYGSFDTPLDPRYSDAAIGETSRDLGARMRDLGMAQTRGEKVYPPHPFAATPPPPVPPQTTQAQPTPQPQPTPTTQPIPARPMSAQPMSAQPMSAQPASGQPGPGYAMPPQPRPPVPPQPDHAHAEQVQPGYAQTRRINPEHYRAPAEAAATERIPHQAPSPEQRGSMPTPLPRPVPLQVERPEETEMAARRLAALLRDDPTLLNQPPD